MAEPRAWTPAALDPLRPGRVAIADLMPAYKDLPEDFRRERTPWAAFVDRWFFEGANAKVLRAKPGVDRVAALRHLREIMGSWEPPHEHKSAGVAYLLSLWFEPITESEARGG